MTISITKRLDSEGCVHPLKYDSFIKELMSASEESDDFKVVDVPENIGTVKMTAGLRAAFNRNFSKYIYKFQTSKLAPNKLAVRILKIV